MTYNKQTLHESIIIQKKPISYFLVGGVSWLSLIVFLELSVWRHFSISIVHLKLSSIEIQRWTGKSVVLGYYYPMRPWSTFSCCYIRWRHSMYALTLINKYGIKCCIKYKIMKRSLRYFYTLLPVVWEKGFPTT